MKKIAAALAAIGFVGLVLTFLLPTFGVNLFGGVSTPPAQAAPVAPTSTCGSKVTYLAYNAPHGSGNFGPAVTSTDLETVKKELKSDFCTDPLLAATNIAFANDGLGLNARHAESMAQRFTGNTTAWKANVNAFFATATNFRLVADNHKYYSIGMIPGSSSNVMPSLVRGEDPVNIGMSLMFKYHGVTREFRLECHFQPVVHRAFPRVPGPHNVCHPSSGNHYCGHSTVPPTRMPSHPTVPPTHTPPTHRPPTHTPPTKTPPTKCTPTPKPGPGAYTYHPGTCTWTKPKGTFDCEQNGIGTDCYNPVRQDPQSDGPGQSQAHKSTPGAGKEPSHSPKGPAPVSGSPAPDPNPGGYDSGSGNGSGTPGGTTCDSSGCTGGGSQPGSGPTDSTNGGDNNGTDGNGSSTGGGDVGNPFG